MTQQPTLSSTAQYIAHHVRQTPDAIAVVRAGRNITYANFAADLLRHVQAL